MDLGFGLPTSGSWATPEAIVEVATTAERLGYTSLWTFQRLLVAVDEAGQPQLPPPYRSVLDPLTLLGFAAAVTDRARLGVAIVNLPYVAPLVLAKQLTTLDHLSRGRLDVGVGIGWSADEFAAVGAALGRRGARAEELLEALRTIWTEPVVEVDDALHRIPPSLVEPKPRQQPTPPILFGGGAPAALARAGRLGAGWISSSQADLAHLDEPIAAVRAAAESAGRDPDSLRFVCRGVVKVRSGERGPLTGSFDDIRSDLADLATKGVTEVFVDLNFDPEIGSPDADPAESLDRARQVLEELAPR